MRTRTAVSSGSSGPPVASTELIRRAQRGERDALDDLFRRELPPLRRWAFTHVPASVRRAGNTDDFVQLALLRTFRRLPHLRAADNGTLQPYMRRVLVNLVRDHARHRGRQPVFVPIDNVDVSTKAASARDQMMAAEALKRFRAAIATLGARERAALEARLERGLDYRGVARYAGCASAGAARAMVGRAMSKVSAHLLKKPVARRAR